PPPDYQPVVNDGRKGGWLREKETGNDLQKRFYSMAPSPGGSHSGLARSDGWQVANVYSVDPAPSWVPGVVIAVGPDGPQGVTFRVVDEEDRVSDGTRPDVPGVNQ